MAGCKAVASASLHCYFFCSVVLFHSLQIRQCLVSEHWIQTLQRSIFVKTGLQSARAELQQTANRFQNPQSRTVAIPRFSILRSAGHGSHLLLRAVKGHNVVVRVWRRGGKGGGEVVQLRRGVWAVVISSLGYLTLCYKTLYAEGVPAHAGSVYTYFTYRFAE